MQLPLCVVQPVRGSHQRRAALAGPRGPGSSGTSDVAQRWAPHRTEAGGAQRAHRSALTYAQISSPTHTQQSEQGWVKSFRSSANFSLWLGDEFYRTFGPVQPVAANTVRATSLPSSQCRLRCQRKHCNPARLLVGPIRSGRHCLTRSTRIYIYLSPSLKTQLLA